MSNHEIRVIDVLPGNRAIISTEGLCRVVWRKTGELYEDLVDLPTAHSLVADGLCDVDAISYPSGQTLRFNNEGLSSQRMLRHKQLDGARKFGEPKPSRPFRQKRKHRVKGFRLGRLLNPEVMAAVIPVVAQEGGAA